MRKVVTGGQTGADRGALEAAVALGFPHGGYVPKGRRAEDGIVPDSFTGMIELESDKYADRTERNVIDSDATLVLLLRISTGSEFGGSALAAQGRHFRDGDRGARGDIRPVGGVGDLAGLDGISGGTLLTVQLAGRHNRPCVVVILAQREGQQGVGLSERDREEGRPDVQTANEAVAMRGSGGGELDALSGGDIRVAICEDGEPHHVTGSGRGVPSSEEAGERAHTPAAAAALEALKRASTTASPPCMVGEPLERDREEEGGSITEGAAPTAAAAAAAAAAAVAAEEQPENGRQASPQMGCWRHSAPDGRSAVRSGHSHGTKRVHHPGSPHHRSSGQDKAAPWHVRSGLLEVELGGEGTAGLAVAVRCLLPWLQHWGVSVLNVAGPRESEQPGIQERARELTRCLIIATLGTQTYESGCGSGDKGIH